MSKLAFAPITVDDRELICRYLRPHCEGSCQHSFVSMVSLYSKYGDSFCVSDGFLYLLRKNLCSDGVRVYLAPMGDGNLKKAFETILQDAAQYGCKAKFHTLTEIMKDFVLLNFPGRFEVTERRDYFEYIYSTKRLGEFSGSKLRKKRWEVKSVRNFYGDRLTVETINKEMLPEILRFEEVWIKNSLETHDNEAILKERKMIEFQFQNFDSLSITGVAVRIDGEIQGFAYGTAINDEYYDTIVEKGNVNIKNIYRLLIQEAVLKNMAGFTYVNREEDVGVEGLRKIKSAYGPEILLKKYDVVEV